MSTLARTPRPSGTQPKPKPKSNPKSSRTCGDFELPGVRNQSTSLRPEQWLRIYYEFELGMGPEHPETKQAMKFASWVFDNSTRAIDYIGAKLASHRIVALGEMHRSTRSKELVAKIIKTFAGPNVGIALEIGSDRGAELERIKQGEAKPKPEEWFSDQKSAMGQVFEAARETNTPLFPIDLPEKDWEPQALQREDPDFAVRARDPHMAAKTGEALQKVDRLLILIGERHLYQQPAKFLGPRLAEAYGSDLFRAAILDESRIGQEGHLAAMSKILSVAFEGRDSPAFDLAGSPLGRAKVLDNVALPDALDGLIFATGIARSSMDPQDYCAP